MTDADTTDTSANTPNPAQGGASKVDQELATIKAQLESMNQQFQQGFNALAEANNKKPAPAPKADLDPDDAYNNPQRYTQRILEQADQIARKHLDRERELNTTIYNLTRDYPEISSDATLQKTIQELHNQLPESIRGTATGYETAALKAVSKAGLMPKARRQVVEEDVSVGSGRSSSSSGAKGKPKVSEKMLILADLLGRDTSDPKVLKGIEDAAARDNWNRYK